MDKNSILYKTLARGLSVRRPHNGTGARYFTQWLLWHMPKHYHTHFDLAGNLHVYKPETSNLRTSVTATLFVAHVDTVHRNDGANKIIKSPREWRANGAPLGADDGAGCAMLMHLIHADVPGYYIFTQGEEVGGIGARFLSKNSERLLSSFDRAIAFDRRATDSVITHQGYGRCCSDVFAEDLSYQLQGCGLWYSPDDTGVYTDTAEFVDYIPECTNLSVGYYREHSEHEYLDIEHFEHLSEAVLDIDWEALPTVRKPGDDGYDEWAWAEASAAKWDAGKWDEWSWDKPEYTQ